MAEKVKWTVEQGARFIRTLTYKDSAGNPIDLTGYSVRMDIRRHQDRDSELILDVDGGNYISISNAAGGEITLEIPASETEKFDWDSPPFFDIEIDDGGSPAVVTRLLKGELELDPEVTA